MGTRTSDKTVAIRTCGIFVMLMFVVLHRPGWYFMGRLFQNLTDPAGGALSIFLLGLAFG